MTPAQLATLKAAVLADSTANAFPNTSDGNFACAAYLNTVPAVPVQLWRPDITPTEINSTIVYSAYVVLTAIKQNGLLQLTQGATVNATSATVRQGFSDIFGAGATLTALTALAQRPGTRFEVIFSSGGPPAVSTMFGQRVAYEDVQAARNS